MKRFYLLFVLAVVMTAAACQREESISDEPEPFPELSAEQMEVTGCRPVSVGMSAAKMDGDVDSDTKSSISLSATEFKLAYLFAFDAEGAQHYAFFKGGRPLAVKTTEKAFVWDLPSGINPQTGHNYRLDIFVIVNPDPKTQATLEEMMASSDMISRSDFVGASGLKMNVRNYSEFMNFEETGMPMSCWLKDQEMSTGTESLSFTLKRLFARYDIRLNNSLLTAAGYTITGLNVNCAKSNKAVDYFLSGSTGSRAAVVDSLAQLDFAQKIEVESVLTFGGDNKSEGVLTVFLPENCQGDNSSWPSGVDSEHQRWYNVYKKSGNSLYSYIELDVSTSHTSGIERSFIYRFYPGQNNDMCSNFDVVRNSYKKVVLNLPPKNFGEKRDFYWHTKNPKCAPGETIQLAFETQDMSGVAYMFDKSYSRCSFGGSIKSVTQGLSSYLDLPLYFIEFTAADNAKIGTEVIVTPEISDINYASIKVMIEEDNEFFEDVDILYRAKYCTEWSCMDIKDGEFLDNYSTVAGHSVPSGYYAKFSLESGTGGFDSSGVFNIDTWTPLVGSQYSCIAQSGCHSPEYEYGNGIGGALTTHIYYNASGKVFIYGYPQAGLNNKFILSIPVSQPYDGSVGWKKKIYNFPSGEMPKLGLNIHDEILGKDTFIKPYNTEIGLEDYRRYLVKAGTSNKYKVYPVLCDRSGDPIVSDNLIFGQAFSWGAAGPYQAPGTETYTNPITMCYRSLFREQKINVDFDDFTTYGSSIIFTIPATMESNESYRCNTKDGIRLSFASLDDPEDYGGEAVCRFYYGRDLGSGVGTSAIYDNSNTGVIFIPKYSVSNGKLEIIEAKAGTNVYSEMVPNESGSLITNDDVHPEFYLAPGLKQTYFIGCAAYYPDATVEYISGPCARKPGVTINPYGYDGLYRMDVTVPYASSSDMSFIHEFHGYHPNFDASNINETVSKFKITLDDGVTSNYLYCYVLWAKSRIVWTYSPVEPSTQEESFSQATSHYLKAKAYNPMGFHFWVDTDVSVQTRMKKSIKTSFDVYPANIGDPNGPMYDQSMPLYTASFYEKDVLLSKVAVDVEGNNCKYNYSPNKKVYPYSLHAILDNASYMSEGYQICVYSWDPVSMDVHQDIHPVPTILNVSQYFTNATSDQPGLSFTYSADFAGKYFTWNPNELPSITYKWFGPKYYYSKPMFSGAERVNGYWMPKPAEGITLSGENAYDTWCDRWQYDYYLTFVNSPGGNYDKFELITSKDSPWQYHYYKKLNWSMPAIPSWNSSSYNLITE